MSKNPAEKMVEIFGSQTTLARELGTRQSTVQSWIKAGRIPVKWHGDIVRAARKKKLEVRPEHLIPVSDAYFEGQKSHAGIEQHSATDIAVHPSSNLTETTFVATVQIENVEELEESSDIVFELLPKATFRGYLTFGTIDIPCYVLDNGQRVIGRTSLTEWLTGIRGGGALEQYLATTNLRRFLDFDSIVDRMVSFRLSEVEGLGKSAKGLPADLVIEICQAFVSVLEASVRPDSDVVLTSRQTQMAIKAGMFVAGCAKVGLDALIDEATGYQYERAADALQFKLRMYLADEMRQWEKTFPDELWIEFGRLTNWKGAVTKRPKYWGKLVMELVYDYLDPDVSHWLKENAPKPRHGQNYHLWLNDQFGLKKLVEHIWMLIGMASACHNMSDLRTKMAEKFGRQPVQYTLFLPPPTKEMRP